MALLIWLDPHIVIQTCKCFAKSKMQIKFNFYYYMTTYCLLVGFFISCKYCHKHWYLLWFSWSGYFGSGLRRLANIKKSSKWLVDSIWCSFSLSKTKYNQLKRKLALCNNKFPVKVLHISKTLLNIIFLIRLLCLRVMQNAVQ